MESTNGRSVAFICRVCGEAIGDPAYRGPWGHAPADVCFTCWVNAFEQPPWHWPRNVLAVWLIANGHTRAEAARRVGASERTVRRWLIAARKDLSEFLEFMSGFDGPSANRRLKGGVRVR
jgi:hypothetical protein